jgi:DNA polymerase-3 subunit delta
MLGRQMRILLGARAMLDQNAHVTKQEVGSALEIHPFVAQKALEQARVFALGDLVRAHDLLFEFDQKIKTGRMGADLSVDLVVDELTNPIAR